MCTKATIRTIAVSVFTMATWLPNLVTRVAFPDARPQLVYAMECLTYVNCLVDPIVYVVAFHVIRMIKPLNPKSNFETSLRISEPQNGDAEDV